MSEIISTDIIQSKIYTVAKDTGMTSLYQRKLEHFGYVMENTETIKLTTLARWFLKVPEILNYRNFFNYFFMKYFFSAIGRKST